MSFRIYVLIGLVLTSCMADQKIDLNRAIKIAIENNRTQKITQLNLDIAKAQLKQAQSALYPSIDFNSSVQRRDEDVAYSLKGDIPLPAAFSALGVSSLPVDVNTTILGRDTVLNTLGVNYTLYSGGKIESIINQAKLNKKIQQKAIVRQTSEVIFDVKRFFYARRSK